MSSPPLRLPFEKEIYEMEELLAQLEADANGQARPARKSAASAASWSTSSARSTAT